MATTRDDIIKALYKHIGECQQCGGKGVRIKRVSGLAD